MKAKQQELLTLEVITDKTETGARVSVEGLIMKVVKRDYARLVIEAGNVRKWQIFADFATKDEISDKRIRKGSTINLIGLFRSSGQTSICLGECSINSGECSIN